jgi:hypothetical protein
LQLLAAGALLLTASIPAAAQGNPPPGPLPSDTVANNQQHQTLATIGGSGAGATMYIECAWEVVDVTPLTRTFDYSNGINDDDNTSQDQTLSDGFTTAGAPCVPDTAQNPANMVNFKRHSIQLRPNPDNADDTGTPGTLKRQYEKWVAVESTSVAQIGDVFWKVWEPYVNQPPFNNSPSPGPFGPNCGPLSQTNSSSPIEVFPNDPTASGLNTREYCLKYQHHATANRGPVATGNPLVNVTCTELQSSLNTQMFQQAINEGQMTTAERDAIITRCFQNEKAVYKVLEDVSKDQPCGEYRVETTVVNTSGSTTKIVNFFDVLCFIYLKTDFTTVNWGTIQNNSASNKSGNMIFDPTDDQPTIRNVGNAPLYLEGGFDPLVFQADPTKTITQFDIKLRAEWQPNVGSLTIVDPIFARNGAGKQLWACFGDQPIGPNQNGKLDLSVHPINAQAGAYVGNLDLVARTDCTTAPRIPSTNAQNPNAGNTYFY